MSGGRFTLEGQRILVTGAGGILGSAFAAGLIGAGAHVVGVDADEQSLVRLRDQLSTPQLSTRVLDISDEAAVGAAVDDIWADGPLDGLLNNAASKSSSLDGFFADFDKSTLDTWREVNSVNLDGSYLVAREVGSRMATGGGGAIVQIASIYGVVAPDQRIYEGSEYLGRQISSPAMYSASKAGVLGLMKYMATWWGDKGVRVNAITPGGVASGQNDVFEQRYSERVPLGRMATEDDIVGPAIFLYSPAAKYMTGHNLIVDGGLTAW